MTDFHSHVLPGIDDGSDSTETSLQMLDMWRKQGIGRICATPHFYAEYNTPERFLKRRNAAYAALRGAMGDDDSYPSFLLGAEVRFFDGISGTRELPALCLQGTELLLLEMPFTKWSDRMLGEVDDICRRGIQPVAAHIERYFSYNDKKTMRRFMELDILVQCNAEFFLTRRTSRKALHMLREGRIHFLGSDAHNVGTRCPNIGPALDLISRKLGPGAVGYLQRMEELIDSGKEIPV